MTHNQIHNGFKIWTWLLVLFLWSCGSGIPKNEEEQKKLLQQYRQELQEVEAKIRRLKVQMGDTVSRQKGRQVTVTLRPVRRDTFRHVIHVQGNTESDANILIASEVSGKVAKMYVKTGDRVQAGDLLLELDKEMVRAELAEAATTLELAQEIYERRKRLWEQEIGARLEYVKAKNEKETLEKRVERLQVHLRKHEMRAPVSGTVDERFVKSGEMLNAGAPALRLINLQDIKVVADVSERYVRDFREGDPVEVAFDALERNYQSTIGAVGRFINPNNRTFKVEVPLDNRDDFLRPNLIGVVKLQDYTNPEALLIPTNRLQHDNEGAYVFVVDTTEASPKARKQRIKTGKSYGGMTEVKEELEDGQMLVDKGFNLVSDKQSVRIVKREIIP